MRGKHDREYCGSDKWRITPAHAGKTWYSVLGLFKTADHPRACGENQQLIKDSERGHGSPPRMRGKLENQVIVACLRRITPAHAGKTRSCSPDGRCSPDHPRACGENQRTDALQAVRDGSPPRMRGKLFRNRAAPVHARITPAHAGKTTY